jgi:hypothetical protein
MDKSVISTRIHALKTVVLKEPLDIIIIVQEDSIVDWKAYCPSISVYAEGEYITEAIDSLRKEIEELWHTLNSEGQVSASFEMERQLLNRLIIQNE